MDPRTRAPAAAAAAASWSAIAGVLPSQGLASTGPPELCRPPPPGILALPPPSGGASRTWAPVVPPISLPPADGELDMNLLMSELLAAGPHGASDEAAAAAAAGIQQQHHQARPTAVAAHSYGFNPAEHAPPPRTAAAAAPRLMSYAPHVDAAAQPRGRYGSAPMVAMPAAMHHHHGAPPPAASEPPADIERLVRWIEQVIRQHGGRVIGANLGSALANSNSSLYRSIKTRFGGLTPLLGKFPDRFVLENDPPFNHVSLRGRAFLGGGEGGGGGGPLGAHPAPPPADAPLLLAPLPLPRGAPMPVVSERRAPGDVETALVKATAGILREVAGGSLKAVELANMLRARMGTETLAAVREHHGGLLALLERHPGTFRVSRIPKNDCVALESGAWAASGGAGGAGVGAEGAASSLGLLDPTSHMVPSAVASKCLHVGNVAASLTDAELRSQFGAFGRIEALKLVSQKGRRFAFVNFVTVEEAERAKAGLCKMHMWRSNISFARRETIAIGAPPPGGGGGGVGVAGGFGLGRGDLDDEEDDGPVFAGGGSGGAGTDAASIDAKRHRWLRTRNLTPSRHLWIGCLYNSSKAEVLERFRAFGPVDDVNYLKDRHCAFVDFVHVGDCVNAFRAMQGARVGDQVVELGFGRNRGDASGGVPPPLPPPPSSVPAPRGAAAAAPVPPPPPAARAFDDDDAAFIHGHADVVRGGLFAPPPLLNGHGHRALPPSTAQAAAAATARAWGTEAPGGGGGSGGGARGTYAAYDAYGAPPSGGAGPPPPGVLDGGARWSDPMPSPLLSAAAATWPPPPLRASGAAGTWDGVGIGSSTGWQPPPTSERPPPQQHVFGGHDGLLPGAYSAPASTAQGRATLNAMRAAAAAGEWGAPPPSRSGGSGGGGAFGGAWGGYSSDAASAMAPAPTPWGTAMDAPAAAWGGGLGAPAAARYGGGGGGGIGVPPPPPGYHHRGGGFERGDAPPLGWSGEAAAHAMAAAGSGGGATYGAPPPHMYAGERYLH